MVDLHVESGRMVLSGGTLDPFLAVGNQPGTIPVMYVALYGGSLMERIWLTVIMISSSGTLVSFSSDGSYIAVYGAGSSKNGAIIFMDTSTGKVRAAFDYPGYANTISNRYRSILLANDPITAGNYNLFGHI